VGRGFAWIQSRGIRIYSCYISRNDTDANYANFLRDIEQSVRSADLHCSVIIGGDFNARSQEWGSVRNDAKGDQLANLAASLDLLVGNVGTKPTYRRINAESVIDVKFHRC
jgi:endonuclease/exonuclease/phosphatase family metal-dependent hydrolase